jgi:hypothetical protein
MKRLCILTFALALTPVIAYGDPQKPAATQPTHTRANKPQADVSKSGHDTSNAIIKHLTRTAPPSNKTHGNLGGDLQKPHATQTSTKPQIMNDARKRRDERQKTSVPLKVNPPSNKTHGVMGGGGLLDQGSGLNQSGPVATGSPTTIGAPTSRGQVIK